jgi:nitrate/nitrite transporter NarK
MSKDMRKEGKLVKSSDILGNPGRGLMAGTIAFFAGFAAVALFGITVHSIAPLLHLTIVEIGWLVAIPLLTGSLLRIPFGALADAVGGRRTIMIQLLAALIGMAGLILTLTAVIYLNSLTASVGYALLMLFGAVAGIGISIFASGIAYVSYWFPQRRQGYALGTFAGVGNAAPGIFTAILPFALVSIGLIGSYIAWAIFLAIMILVFFLIGHDAYYFQLVRRGLLRSDAIDKAKALGEELVPSGSTARSLAIAARAWRTWPLTIMYLTSFGGFEALTEWLPTYWTKYLGISLVLAGILTGIVYSLLTALIRVLGGWWSDRWSGEMVAIVSYLILILGSVLFMTSHSLIAGIISEVVMAMGMGIANAAVFKMVPKYVPEAVGGATGWVGGLGAVGGLLIPPIMAYIAAVMGKPGYAYGFIIFVILGILSMILALILWSTSR